MIGWWIWCPFFKIKDSIRRFFMGLYAWFALLKTISKRKEKKPENHWCNFYISAGKFRNFKIKKMQSFVLKKRINILALWTRGGSQRIKATINHTMRTNSNIWICTINSYKWLEMIIKVDATLTHGTRGKKCA